MYFPYCEDTILPSEQVRSINKSLVQALENFLSSDVTPPAVLLNLVYLLSWKFEVNWLIKRVHEH